MLQFNIIVWADGFWISEEEYRHAPHEWDHRSDDYTVVQVPSTATEEDIDQIAADTVSCCC